MWQNDRLSDKNLSLKKSFQTTVQVKITIISKESFSSLQNPHPIFLLHSVNKLLLWPKYLRNKTSFWFWQVFCLSFMDTSSHSQNPFFIIMEMYHYYFRHKKSFCFQQSIMVHNAHCCSRDNQVVGINPKIAAWSRTFKLSWRFLTIFLLLKICRCLCLAMKSGKKERQKWKGFPFVNDTLNLLLRYRGYLSRIPETVPVAEFFDVSG